MVTIKDVFEIKAAQNLPSGSGTVIIVDDPSLAEPQVGAIATIALPSGETIELEVDQVKSHGTGRSMFFKNVTMDSIPAGSCVASLK